MGARMLRWSFLCGRGLGLHGAEKGVEAREVAEHVFSSGEFALIVDFACPMMAGVM